MFEKLEGTLPLATMVRAPPKWWRFKPRPEGQRGARGRGGSLPAEEAACRKSGSSGRSSELSPEVGVQ